MQSSSLSNRLYNSFKRKTKLFLTTPLVLYWIALFTGTTLPTDELPHLFKAQDKFEHFFGYFGLSVLVSLFLHFQKRWEKLKEKTYLFSFLIITCYAAFDELHQLFIPGRECDILDWTADSIGGLIGIALVYLFIRANTKKQIATTVSS